ncbi:aminodeoxychorismate/anthranilate synthase component II [Lentisphaerota bacterium ZTH]|nr:aminodeoxychorismate/anthranilate synthase component II [Lentisphaerota bacterium]WET05397.1 aminodeoxychorismate/anthranilate synthase component II [Lentisphaerota bacterium ZTH]
MILMIDNYDSFTYNLVQYLYGLNQQVVVKRNDEISVEEALGQQLEAIVISPGPGRPENAGITLDLIKQAAGKIPILGVCLGHQAMGEAFGAKVVQAQKIMHGKISEVEHDGKGIFAGLSSPIKVVRYHSLALDENTLPDCFEISARAADDGEIMGIRHKEFQMEGIQYHPESVLTSTGKRQLANFVKIIGKGV